MGDVVRYTEGGREYAVYGLEAKAQSIAAASRSLDADIDAAVSAARAALREWRGPHSATMATQHNEVVDAAFGVALQLSVCVSICRSFPAAFTPSGYIGQAWAAQQRSAEVTAPDPDGSVSAVPADLEAYAETVTGSFATAPSRAATVDYSGLRAEVTYERPLTPEERFRRAEHGADEATLDAARVGVTEPYPVTELITLVAPTDEAATAVARSLVAADFASAVAQAFSEADQGRLDLLAEAPEVASFLVPGGAPDVLVGDTAIRVVQEHFATLDVAADGGDPDDNVSRDDLEAAAADESLPPELRAAAQYLLDNPSLHTLVETAADERGPIGADGGMSSADVSAFLTTQEHLRVLQENMPALDVAHEGGDADGYVSRDDLEAAAADTSLPDDVRAAAQYLLDNDGAFYGVADREELGRDGWPGDGGGFTTYDLIGRLVDGQAYVHDPVAAEEFVTSLPVATDGERGIPIWASSDDGVRALAGSALMATNGDLTDVQAVIAHLPESEGAVRNQLITAYYDMLAQRVDGVTTTAWDIPAGDPSAPGSGGANWLVYAPWASNGVRTAIDGSFSAMGIHPSWDQRQAAADGNQWIFNDITARFAAFVELYEQNGGQPSSDQVDHLFATSFSDGDAEIRDGFLAYVAAMGSDDPAERQRLMFTGNTLVATHEQAGAQPYLDIVTDVPILSDSISAEFIDLRVGVHSLEVNQDLELFPDSSNLLIDEPILSLDPTASTRPVPPGVELADISGWSDEGFPTSTASWLDTAGYSTEIVYVDPYSGYPITSDEEVDPDATLSGTAAGDWGNYDDRMWYIHRMFEQTHTDASLYNTEWVYDSSGGGSSIDFLPDDVQGWVERP